jgi:hypothetical protein
VVEENKTYYFFDGERGIPKKITGEQVAHIEETYGGFIDNFEFVKKEIISPRHVVEIEGLALCKSGFIKRTDYFPLRQLREILQEPIQRNREFETVFYIKNKNEHGYEYGWFNSGNGELNFNLEINLYRRAINNKKSDHKRKKYDYYRIPMPFDPDDERVINYMPLDSDFEFDEWDDGDNSFTIPYSRNRYETFEKLTDAFRALGMAINDFLASDMKKALPYFGNERNIE